MTELPSFHYVIPSEIVGARHSAFQRFEAPWTEAYDRIATIVQFPACPADLLWGFKRRLSLRCSGRARYSIIVGSPEQISELSPPPFMILVTSAATDAWGRKYITKHPEPVLHLPDQATEGEMSWRSARPEIFRQFTDAVLARLREFTPEPIDEFLRSEEAEQEIDAGLPQLRITTAVITLPNRLSLISVQYPKLRVEEFEPAHESQDAVREAFDAVVAVREKYLENADYHPLRTSLLLSAAGMSRKMRRVLKVRSKDPIETEIVQATRLVQNRRALDRLSREMVQTFPAESVGAEILQEREAELQGHVAAVLVESASQFLPTVMLQSGWGKSDAQGEILRRQFRWRVGNWRQAAVAAAQRIGADLAASLPDYVVEYMRKERGAVKALMDEPVELLAIEGRPLAMSRPVVRLPVTPGFVLARKVSAAAPLILEPDDFKEILVLRGTNPRDPVHQQVEEFARNIASQVGTAHLHVVDVRTAEDVQRALNDFRGAMMAFDAHGLHSARTSGVLQIGEALLNMQKLEARLPPIVFLASCDTHGLARSEETVAAALLLGGATTVIGTLVPVSAPAAALLFSDLVGRASYWVPPHAGLIRWSELFASAQWACHATETAFVLSEAGVLRMAPAEIGIFVDQLGQTLSGVEDWFDMACEGLANASGVEKTVIRSEWLRLAYVTDCSMFCQLGQADGVFIKPPPSRPVAVP